MKTYKEVLINYLPETTVPKIIEWLENSNVQLKISKSRSTKLGDYRPPIRVSFHKISVNHDLNKYQFLITLVHEFAHLKVWENYKRSVNPHGKEWKNEFNSLMQGFLCEDVFPKDILKVLMPYLKNPSSSTSDTKLLQVLRKYDKTQDYITLEDLPENSIFKIYNGYVFEKIEKLRKRYKCKRLDNNRIYLVSPMIKVVPVKN